MDRALKAYLEDHKASCPNCDQPLVVQEQCPECGLPLEVHIKAITPIITLPWLVACLPWAVLAGEGVTTWIIALRHLQSPLYLGWDLNPLFMYSNAVQVVSPLVFAWLLLDRRRINLMKPVLIMIIAGIPTLAYLIDLVAILL
ncbi:MAG: hypothetical protein VX527_02935 [Planctomycetota bacterium]|nr:hypothetical protein [Planctomycetota bacterium]